MSWNVNKVSWDGSAQNYSGYQRSLLANVGILRVGRRPIERAAKLRE